MIHINVPAFFRPEYLAQMSHISGAAVSIVAQFNVRHTRYLAPDGWPIEPLPRIGSDVLVLKRLYRGLVLTRTFDAKAIALQRTGRLGTYASSLGQEAVSVGAASAMQPEDVLLPSFREHGGQIWRGASMVELLLYWGGDERGNSFGEAPHDFPVCVPVASHAPHAVGVALAFALRRERRVALCILGDGATSKGDFAEALNFAGVWKLPVVFVISNNQWAISVPLSKQTAATTLAQKAIAAGITGEQVDGNDVIAVHDVVGRALEQARAGEGPAVIEALTYRLGDHTTADDASRYRNDADVTPHWHDDPIARLRSYLIRLGEWSRPDEESLLTETAADVERAANAYLATPPQAAETIFDFTYAVLPADLVEQKSQALAVEPRNDSHA